MADEQRVAIGRLPGHVLGADQSAGPGPVLDDDALAEGLRQVRRDQARHRVHQTARRELRDQADGAASGPGALGTDPGRGGQGRGTGGQDETTLHGNSWVVESMPGGVADACIFVKPAR